MKNRTKKSHSVNRRIWTLYRVYDQYDRPAKVSVDTILVAVKSEKCISGRGPVSRTDARTKRGGPSHTIHDGNGITLYKLRSAVRHTDRGRLPFLARRPYLISAVGGRDGELAAPSSASIERGTDVNGTRSNRSKSSPKAATKNGEGTNMAADRVAGGSGAVRVRKRAQNS